MRRIKKLAVRKVVVIDEMGADTKMTRTHGRAPKGERVIDSIPYKDNKRVSIIGALKFKELITSMTIEGSIDGLAFDRFVEFWLLPHLTTGDTVILDNYKVHLSERAKSLIESVGATILFLPPYSPDFSPIENYWSKVKKILRDRKARTRRMLDKSLEFAYNSISVIDILGWFEHCGFLVSLK